MSINRRGHITPVGPYNTPTYLNDRGAGGQALSSTSASVPVTTSRERIVYVMVRTRQKRDRGTIQTTAGIETLAPTDVLARIVGWWVVWICVEAELEEREYSTRPAQEGAGRSTLMDAKDNIIRL
jgi:hypothetical protein